MVYAIQNSTKRLTNLQKDKYYYLLNKYPQNESLLSIKHLVPPLAITLVKVPKVKALKKKQKQDITQSNNESVSYPMIKYEDKSYPIIKYEDKTSSNSENKSGQSCGSCEVWIGELADNKAKGEKRSEVLGSYKLAARFFTSSSCCLSWSLPAA